MALMTQREIPLEALEELELGLDGEDSGAMRWVAGLSSRLMAKVRETSSVSGRAVETKAPWLR